MFFKKILLFTNPIKLIINTLNLKEIRLQRMQIYYFFIELQHNNIFFIFNVKVKSKLCFEYEINKLHEIYTNPKNDILNIGNSEKGEVKKYI